MALDILDISFRARTEEFERGARRVRGELESVRKSVTDTTISFASIAKGALAFTGASAAIAAVGQSFPAVISGVIESGDKIKSLRLAFDALTTDAQKSREQLAFVTRTSYTLGVSVADLAGAYKGLLAASRGTSLEGEKTQAIFTAMTRASRVLGLSQEELQGSLLAVSQMMSKGKISAEELTGQLGERFPGAVQIMARALGVSTARLQEMMAAGNLLAEEAIPLWAEQLEKELGQKAEKAALTASQGLTNLKNVAIELVSGPGQALSEWVGGLADKLARVGREAIEAGKRLDEVAKKQTAEDVQRTTRGNVADTPANKARIEQLQQINREIAGVEATLDENRRRLATRKPEDNSFFGRLAEERLKLAVDRAERQIAELKKQRDLLEKAITRGNQPNPMEEAETGGLPPNNFQREQEAQTKKGQEFLKAVDEIAKKAQEIRSNAIAGGMSPIETARKELQFINSELEKLQQKYGSVFQPSVSTGTGQYAAPPAIAEKIRAIAPEFQLDPTLVEAVISRESNFNPRATSPRGAQGLMQLMPGTARELGVTNAYDIEQNLRGGMQYLRKLLDMFNNDLRLALAAYNAGPGAVKKHGGIPPYTETQAYVPDVLKRHTSLQGTNAPPNRPENITAASLVAYQRALENFIAQSRGDEEANKAVTESLSQRSESLSSLIESLKDGTRAMTEYETAQIREQLASVQGFEGAKARVETLLKEIDVRRELVEMFKRESAEQEAKRQAEQPARELLKQMQDEIDRLTMTEDEYWEKRIRSMNISNALMDEVIAKKRELRRIENMTATPSEARDAIAHLRQKPENLIGTLDDDTLNSYQRAFQDIGDQIVNAFGRGTDAIEEFARTGRFNIKQFLADIHSDLTRWAFQGLIMKPLQNMLTQGAKGENWEQSKKLMVNPFEQTYGWLLDLFRKPAEPAVKPPAATTPGKYDQPRQWGSPGLRESWQEDAQKISEQGGWKLVPPRTTTAPLGAPPVGTDRAPAALTQSATTQLQAANLFSQSVQSFSQAVASFAGRPPTASLDPTAAPQAMPYATPEAPPGAFAEIASRSETTGDATIPANAQQAAQTQAAAANNFAGTVSAFTTSAANFATGTQTFAQASTSFASSLIQWAVGEATKEGGWIDAVMGVVGGVGSMGGGSSAGTGAVASGASSAGAGFAADGAQARAGQRFWVGERGPELFIPRTDGRIVSHEESVKIANTSVATHTSITGARATGGPVMPYQAYLVGEKGPEIIRIGAERGHVYPSGMKKELVREMRENTRIKSIVRTDTHVAMSPRLQAMSLLSSPHARRDNTYMQQAISPRAAGGPVFPQHRYLVGERGPEILAMGGGSQQSTVTMNVYARDVGGFRSSQRQLIAQASRMFAGVH